jgi:hemolysin III
MRDVVPARAMYPGQRLNTSSHLAGLVLVLLGAAWVLSRCMGQLDAAAAAGVVAFSLASAVLFIASVMCHGTRGDAGPLWQRLDHAATFWLIAGTLSPFATVAPRQDANLALLAAMWIAALVATAWQFRRGPIAVPPVLLYAGMGWIGTAAAAVVAARVSTQSLVWLLVGAGLYSAGTVFYRNAFGWKHAHGAWHLFVVAGVVSHYAAVYFLLVA